MDIEMSSSHALENVDVLFTLDGGKWTLVSKDSMGSGSPIRIISKDVFHVYGERMDDRRTKLDWGSAGTIGAVVSTAPVTVKGVGGCTSTKIRFVEDAGAAAGLIMDVTFALPSSGAKLLYKMELQSNVNLTVGEEGEMKSDEVRTTSVSNASVGDAGTISLSHIKMFSGCVGQGMLPITKRRHKGMSNAEALKIFLYLIALSAPFATFYTVGAGDLSHVLGWITTVVSSLLLLAGVYIFGAFFLLPVGDDTFTVASSRTWFVNGWESWSYTGIVHVGDSVPQPHPLLSVGFHLGGTRAPGTPAKSLNSHMFGILTDRESSKAVLAGWLSQREQFGLVSLVSDECSIR